MTINSHIYNMNFFFLSSNTLLFSYLNFTGRFKDTIFLKPLQLFDDP